MRSLPQYVSLYRVGSLILLLFLPFMQPPAVIMSDFRHFSKWDAVEIIHDSSIYFPATVIRSPAKTRTHLYVEYQTLAACKNRPDRLKEFVEVGSVRPAPRPEPNRTFVLSDAVDAYRECGWRRGTVVGILVNAKYLVLFEGSEQQVQFDHSDLRLHREWNSGVWNPPFEEPRSELVLKPGESNLKFKIKCAKKNVEPMFKKGTMVEVKSIEDGYHGSWYTAVIVDSIGKNQFLVEYQTLMTEDETEFLKEKADALNIRPYPPIMQRTDRFKLSEKVDAWYNDGWWVGLISEVLDGAKYAVYFWSTNEELEFEHFNLRPHQDWMHGKWFADFMSKSSESPPKPMPGRFKGQNGLKIAEKNYFSVGMKVEVRSEEKGFIGSWYPAVIAGPKNFSKYMVQYKTLKNEDRMEPLKEEADAACIRPCPPLIQRSLRFEPLDKVDAWYKDAWWVGGVCKVYGGSNYIVYLRGTNQVLEFEHSDLRPHQDWIDRHWVTL